MAFLRFFNFSDDVINYSSQKPEIDRISLGPSYLILTMWQKITLRGLGGGPARKSDFFNFDTGSTQPELACLKTPTGIITKFLSINRKA